MFLEKLCHDSVGLYVYVYVCTVIYEEPQTICYEYIYIKHC